MGIASLSCVGGMASRLEPRRGSSISAPVSQVRPMDSLSVSVTSAVFAVAIIAYGFWQVYG
jgi:hypothetical protein